MKEILSTLVFIATFTISFFLALYIYAALLTVFIAFGIALYIKQKLTNRGQSD